MIISGTELAKEIKQDVAKRVAEYKVEYGREPHLVVILVGRTPASAPQAGTWGRWGSAAAYRLCCRI